MVAGCRRVTYLKRTEKLLRHFVHKFLALIRDKFQREPMSANPTVEESRRNSQRLFIWQCNEFNIICEGVGDAQNKFFVSDVLRGLNKSACTL